MSKHKNIGVWACPLCWKMVPEKKLDWFYGSSKKRKKPVVCCCDDDRDGIYFDSQAEYAFAQSLKKKERAGLITELRHHPKNEIAPAYYYRKLVRWHLNDPGSDYESILVHNRLTYEADFSYRDKNGLHFVEVKNATNKEPYIPNLAKFRHKVELLKKIHGIEVEIYTGNIRWKFNGKKLEVAK